MSKPEETNSQSIIEEALTDFQKFGGVLSENDSITTIKLPGREIQIVRDEINKSVTITIKIDPPPYQKSTLGVKMDDKGRFFLPAAYKTNPTILFFRLNGQDQPLQLILTTNASAKPPKGWARTTIELDKQKRISIPKGITSTKECLIKTIGHGTFITVTKNEDSDIDESTLKQLKI